MILSVEEGTKLGMSFVSSFCASGLENNHAEMMRGFFADTVAWKMACGTESDNDSPDILLKQIKDAWGNATSFVSHTKPFISVDTENGIIITTFQLIADINGRIKGVTNITMNPTTYILTINKDKKVVRWDGVWDNNYEDWIQAFTEITKLGVVLPEMETEETPKLITRAEGEAFAAKFLKAFSDAFMSNNHATLCRDLVAETLSWEWSDATKGSDSQDTMFGILASTWGPMKASYIPVDPIVAVDTTNAIISISFHVVCNLNGGFKDENNAVMVPEVMILHLNEDGKADKFQVYWDSNDASLQTVLAKLKAKLEVTSANATKVLNVDSGAEALMTGQ